MMLYKNTKVKVHSLNGDTDYFDIVSEVPQGDTLASYWWHNTSDKNTRLSRNTAT